jgi:hypothetical protein
MLTTIALHWQLQRQAAGPVAAGAAADGSARGSGRGGSHTETVAVTIAGAFAIESAAGSLTVEAEVIRGIVRKFSASTMFRNTS